MRLFRHPLYWFILVLFLPGLLGSIAYMYDLDALDKLALWWFIITALLGIFLSNFKSKK